MALLIVGRGDPVAVATTLASLSFDDPGLIAPGSVVIVDDRAGYASSGPLGDLAKRFGAQLVAADEFAGWAAVDIACDAVVSGPMVVVEAGVVMSPAPLRAAIAAVADDPLIVFVARSERRDVPYDLVVVDRAAWPRLPALRGFGGVDTALERHWRRSGHEVRVCDTVELNVLSARISTVDSRATPSSTIRNALVAEHWLDGDHAAVIDRLSTSFDPDTVQLVAAQCAAELASPVADLDAVYWLPEHAQRGGWPAARAAFARAGINQIVRRLPRIEVSLTGEVREAMIVATIARRAVTRRWDRVAIIEGAFEMGPFEDGAVSNLSDEIDTPDVLFLDNTVGSASIQHPGAVLLRPRAMSEIAEAVPRQLAAVGEWTQSGWNIARLLQDRISSNELTAATVQIPLIRRVECVGPWLRW
jgi:hypothetical protein